WPGSYCDTKHSCCYPRTGKPVADFGIHGLWPQNADGSYPQNCNRDNALDEDQISDLTSSLQKDWPSLSCPSSTGFRFWSHEWEKHGTCAESEEIDQHGYFEAALKLKEKANLLQALNNAGIKPDDEFYDLDSIKEAIKDATGFTPGIECNIDASKNSQLYQVFMCVDISGGERFCSLCGLSDRIPSSIEPLAIKLHELGHASCNNMSSDLKRGKPSSSFTFMGHKPTL
ncbi:hypothetical protein H0E87_031387, partial [Populus deltoides]